MNDESQQEVRAGPVPPASLMEVRLSFSLLIATLFILTGEAWGVCGRIDRTFSAQLEEAIVLYQAGWAGSDEALRRAIEALEREGFPELETNAARAYRGSAYIAFARLVPDRQKPRWLKRGGKELDRAVEEATKDVAVRLLRLRSYALLPRLAGKWEMVLEDAAWLLEVLESDSDSGGCRYEILFQTGSVYLRDRNPEALRLLVKAMEEAPTKALQEKASKLHQLATLQFPANTAE